jgi:hypothetical protein
MEMNLPGAFVIGLGFGFFLERAGLGDSRKLTAQFYGYDMTVFKVMFTAIITAMLGLFWLDRFGLIASEVLTPLQTYAVPQLIGGMIFGAGFIVGGFCPGTSCVALSLGRGDGWSFLGGMMIGMAAFHAGGESLANFAVSGSWGTMSLAEVFGLSHATTVGIIVAGAIGAFWGAEWIERKFSA